MADHPNDFADKFMSFLTLKIALLTAAIFLKQPNKFLTFCLYLENCYKPLNFA